MVSNTMNVHGEMRYWPLLCGSSAEEGTYCMQETPEQLARPASQQQRKDTEDSGIGACTSEFEEDVQEYLSDWCRKCLEIDSGKSILHKGSIDEDDEFEEDKIISDNDSIDDETLSDGGITNKNAIDFLEVGYPKPDSNDEKESWACKQDGVSQIVNRRDRDVKSYQRQRRITPVPLSNPLKLTLASSSDCLFVEEEDTDDIQLFNLEEEFVDQGFCQLTPSPRGSPRLGNKFLNGNKAAESYKMDSDKDKANKDFSLSRSPRPNSGPNPDQTKPRLSPELTKRHCQEVRGRSQTHFITDDSKSLSRAMHCHLLYKRSQSETDACIAMGGMSRGSGWVGAKAIKSDHEKSEEVEEEEAAIQPASKGEDFNMASEGIPHIALSKAAAPILPDWMREAKGERDAAPGNSSQIFAGVGECGSEPLENVNPQANSSVKLRSDGAQTFREFQSLKDHTGINEDIIKIYTPQKYYEGKKPKRNRKLTPARASSPSLEKLADLQSQFYALSLAEQDSD